VPSAYPEPSTVSTSSVVSSSHRAMAYPCRGPCEACLGRRGM